ncbi:hypothetical protein C0584_03330 [Candidatus Parcubacteria bacterium]|nr:MAG: hypothetical protein C0584_03330 [Candidatus Parcubacteria bacterium]
MKKVRKALTLVVVFSLVLTYAVIPVANAASLSNVSDTLSTSAPSTLANHTVDFDTAVVLDTNGYIEVELQSASFGIIGDTADITCQGNGTEGTSTPRTASCLYDTDGLATGTQQIVINNITNPTAGIYDVEIRTYDSGDTLLESSIVKVAVIDTVTVTAHVDSTLTFALSGVNNGVTINGDATTGTSTATTTAFGDILPGTQYILGQQLGVTTNASDGFQVTVTQNSDFDTAAGAIIDSFVDGSATTTPTDWIAPSGDLDTPTTWGHLGFASDENDSLNGETTFADGFYAGLTVGTPFVIMGHNGPSSNTEADKGLTNVAYSVQINALQEAGDYETTLTYVVTPTY